MEGRHSWRARLTIPALALVVVQSGCILAQEDHDPHDPHDGGQVTLDCGDGGLGSTDRQGGDSEGLESMAATVASMGQPELGFVVMTDGTSGFPVPSEEPSTVADCHFDYDETFVYDHDYDYDYHDHDSGASRSPSVMPRAGQRAWPRLADTTTGSNHVAIGATATVEPAPPGTMRFWPSLGGYPLEDDGIVLPTYQDDLPVFARALPWNGQVRCYETPDGPQLLDESQAFDLYSTIVRLTTGGSIDETPSVRTVVGIRGAYPGQLLSNGNLPDRFNDTLILLWRTEEDEKTVREVPASTDPGAADFDWYSSSSLRANRRYRYANGWHRGYHALRVGEYDYLVRDDTNKNGHWDSDRNGWLPPPDLTDHDRVGNGHNIHMASVSAPLGRAAIGRWSAGCQVIPGIANWTHFITKAWTSFGNPVDYYLIDVRDIDPQVWWPCPHEGGTGTHACPFRIAELPFSHAWSTEHGLERRFDQYNCSPANEAGPETVYLLTIDRPGVLVVTVDDVRGDLVDVDVHLLDGDDQHACLARANVTFSRSIEPGRYYIVVDTFVEDGEKGGVERTGPYRLWVSLD
ncbi:MAG: hypothetical protein V2A73_01075 [Pseudomonadota bacterium]